MALSPYLRKLLLRTWQLVILYSFLRLVFVLVHKNLLHGIPLVEILSAFWLGLRFDANIITIVSLPAFIMALILDWIPSRKLAKGWGVALGVWLALTQIPLVWICIGDVVYFSFTGRRVNTSLLQISGDLKDQLGSILWQYGWLSLLGIAIAVILAKGLTHGWPEPRLTGLGVTVSKRRQAVQHFVIVVLWACVVRGGFDLKPLAMPHAFVFEENILGQVALNAPFSLLKGHVGTDIPSFSFFAKYADARAEIAPRDETPLGLLKKNNVVILIVESLALEYTGLYGATPSYTPFLDSLAPKGKLFRQHFANGRRSIDAIPSIVAGIPSLMEEPFITSAYQGNKIPRLHDTWKAAGYSTAFYHGGNNGTMHFDSFTKQVGFERYVGRNEYPEPDRDYDGTWGIWDEPFLQFLCHDMTAGQAQGPQFATVFTLTSHNPFKVPPTLEKDFAAGTLPIHQAIRYTDYALRNFFDCAARQPWYNETLFVITGDHTSLSERLDFSDNLGHFRVPLLFFHPKVPLPDVDLDRPVQHVDILPSVYDLVGMTRPSAFPFGISAFSRVSAPLVYNQEGGNWWLLTRNALVKGRPESEPHVFAAKPPNEKAEDEDLIKKAIAEFHGLAQTFSEGLHDNKWMGTSP